MDAFIIILREFTLFLPFFFFFFTIHGGPASAVVEGTDLQPLLFHFIEIKKKNVFKDINDNALKVHFCHHFCCFFLTQKRRFFNGIS